jgi:hypothetical protein
MASFELSFSVSATAITPLHLLPTATSMAVLASDCSARLLAPARQWEPGFHHPQVADCHPASVHFGFHALTGQGLETAGSADLQPALVAAAQIASPSGCSLPFSTDAVGHRRLAAVIVPVLSSTTV